MSEPDIRNGSRLYPWLSAAIHDLDFVAFDLETTGLDKDRDRIVEIGAVRFRVARGGASLGATSAFERFVDPRMPISPEASAVNGITDEMLRGAPGIETVLPEFLGFAEDAVLVAHNAPFDIGFIDTALARLPVSEAAQLELFAEPPRARPGRSERVIDTRLFAKEAFPGRIGYHLQRLAAELGIPVLHAHRAHDDARVCMELFLRCAIREGLA